MHAQTVCTRPLLGKGKGPGTEEGVLGTRLGRVSPCRPSLLFGVLLHSSVYYTECRTKNGGDLGTRLQLIFTLVYRWMKDAGVRVQLSCMLWLILKNDFYHNNKKALFTAVELC